MLSSASKQTGHTRTSRNGQLSGSPTSRFDWAFRSLCVAPPLCAYIRTIPSCIFAPGFLATHVRRLCSAFKTGRMASSSVRSRLPSVPTIPYLGHDGFLPSGLDLDNAKRCTWPEMHGYSPAVARCASLFYPDFGDHICRMGPMM